MKNKASLFLKHTVSVLSSIAKSKSATIRSKGSAARARLLLLAFVNKKAVLDSLSNKINRFLGHGRGSSDDEDNVKAGDESKAIVHHAARADGACSSSMTHGAGNAADGENYGEEDDEKYPDLRHSLFDEGGSDDDDDDDPGRSVIDIVKDSKEGGEGFSLEDEIDHVADLFIKRFHRQVRLQKLESFKRLQAMLARST